MSSAFTSAATCAVRQVELDQLTRDRDAKQAQVDSCNPSAATARQSSAALQANTTYTAEKTAALTAAVADFENQVVVANTLYNAKQSLDQYLDSLQTKTTTLTTQNDKLEQLQRVQRRNFQDNTPQSGVSGLAGVRTADDKIMLLFWISYIVAIFVVTMLLARTYAQPLRQQLVLGTVVSILALIPAYYCIVKFA